MQLLRILIRCAKRKASSRTTSVEISELLSTILRKRGIQHNVLNAKLHQKEADIVAEAGIKSVVTIATIWLVEGQILN